MKMEGRGWSAEKPCNPATLLEKIRAFTRSLLQHLCKGCFLVVALDRYRSYCTDSSGNCCCSPNFLDGKEIISVEKEVHTRRLDVMLRVLVIIQQLLQENKHALKRDIYYMDPSFFIDQAVVDRGINDICIHLQCSRHNLNVITTGKGLVMGWLRFLEAGRKFDCIRSPSTAYPIPVHVEDVEDIMGMARYVLVVEKETVFQRLANDKFCDANRCIVITGKGYPDVSTRRFLRLLIDKLCLPSYCLVDCDPYGFDILMTYRFGSLKMAYDAKLLSVPDVCWLGVLPSDSETYHLPDKCLLPLTPRDKKKAEAMLNRCYLRREPQWRFELKIMLQRGVKFEIEALSISSFSFLTEEYIPSKIQDMGQMISPSYMDHKQH